MRINLAKRREQQLWNSLRNKKTMTMITTQKLQIAYMTILRNARRNLNQTRLKRGAFTAIKLLRGISTCLWKRQRKLSQSWWRKGEKGKKRSKKNAIGCVKFLPLWSKNINGRLYLWLRVNKTVSWLKTHLRKIWVKGSSYKMVWGNTQYYKEA